MRIVFADTGFWIAVANKKDSLHVKAVQTAQALGPHRVITTEMVLTELLNGMSHLPILRGLAIKTVDQIRSDPNTDVVPQTSDLFENAFTLFRKRPDKNWSLVDCASILTMQERGIYEVLAHDHHFLQAGFSTLLRDDPRPDTQFLMDLKIK